MTLTIAISHFVKSHHCMGLAVRHWGRCCNEEIEKSLCSWLEM